METFNNLVSQDLFIINFYMVEPLYARHVIPCNQPHHLHIHVSQQDQCASTAENLSHGDH